MNNWRFRYDTAQIPTFVRAPAYKRRTPLLGRTFTPVPVIVLAFIGARWNFQRILFAEFSQSDGDNVTAGAPCTSNASYTSIIDAKVLHGSQDIILVEILLPSSLPFVGVPVFVSPLEGHNIVGVPPKGVSVRIRRLAPLRVEGILYTCLLYTSDAADE